MLSSNQFSDPKRIKINKLVEKLKNYGKMDLVFIEETIKKSSSILKKQPNVLTLQSPAIIIGDIHGQFHDLLNILSRYSLQQYKFLFLGDYVDRGLFCIEVLTLLMVLKIQYPNNVHLLRGNHESKNMTSQYNFKLQCSKKYSIEMYEKFLDWFKLLPLAAIIDNKYFCVHGGISPQYTNLNQLQRIKRNIEVPQKGLLCDLLWSDPTDDDDQNWEDNSIRGISYFYSRNIIEKFLKKNNFKMVIRAHQLQDQGFKFQRSNKSRFDQDALSLTLFSAPNYCDKFNNKGANARIQNNQITIETFSETPHPTVLPNYMDVFEWTMPFIFTCVDHLFRNFIGEGGKNSCKRKNIKQIKQELDEYQQKIIVQAIFDKTLASKNQGFPKKYSNDYENQILQQNESIEIQLEKNKENSIVPGPFRSKLQKLKKKSLKPKETGNKLNASASLEV